MVQRSRGPMEKVIKKINIKNLYPMLKLQRSVFVGLENDISSIFRNLETSGLNCTLIYKHALDGIFVCIFQRSFSIYVR